MAKIVINEGALKKRTDLKWIGRTRLFTVAIEEDLAGRVSWGTLGPLFKEAEEYIEKIGFKSQHSYAIITVKPFEVNHITGGETAGHAHPKYIKIALQHITPRIIIHEWAHMVVHQLPKDTIKVLKKKFDELLSEAPKNINFNYYIKTDLIETIVKNLEQDHAIQSFILNNLEKEDMLNLFFHEHDLIQHCTRFPAILRQSVNFTNYRYENLKLNKGDEINIEKVNTGWILTIKGTKHNKEFDAEGIIPFDKIDSYVLLNFDDCYKIVKQQFYGMILQIIEGTYGDELNDELIKDVALSVCGRSIKYTIESVISKEIQFIVDKHEVYAKPDIKPREFIQALFNTYNLPKIAADFLIRYTPKSEKTFTSLLTNDRKFGNMCDSMSDNLSDYLNHAIKLGIKMKSNYGDAKYNHLRKQIALAIGYHDSYGIANFNEWFATALEVYFKLPARFQKAIKQSLFNLA